MEVGPLRGGEGLLGGPVSVGSGGHDLRDGRGAVQGVSKVGLGRARARRRGYRGARVEWARCWFPLGSGEGGNLSARRPQSRRKTTSSTVPRQGVSPQTPQQQSLWVGCCGAPARRRLSRVVPARERREHREGPPVITREEGSRRFPVVQGGGEWVGTVAKQGERNADVPGTGGRRVAVVELVRRGRRGLVKWQMAGGRAVLGGGSRRLGSERVAGRVVETLERELRHGPLCAALRADLATNRCGRVRA